MRKLLLACILVLFLMAGTSAHANGIQTVTISSGTIAASGAYSKTVNASTVGGYWSIQGRVTGSGTCKIEVICSNDGTTFREPGSASDVATGLTSTSGEKSDGRFFYQFYPDMAKYIGLRFTETGGSSSIAITGTMAFTTSEK